MGDITAMLSAELIAIVAVGVTVLLAVLGQAAWLDGKIERVDARLSGKIERLDAKLSNEIKRMEDNLNGRISNLQQGQAAIGERLAAVEGRVAEVPILNRQQVES